MFRSCLIRIISGTKTYIKIHLKVKVFSYLDKAVIYVLTILLHGSLSSSSVCCGVGASGPRGLGRRLTSFFSCTKKLVEQQICMFSVVEEVLRWFS